MKNQRIFDKRFTIVVIYDTSVIVSNYLIATRTLSLNQD